MQHARGGGTPGGSEREGRGAVTKGGRRCVCGLRGKLTSMGGALTRQAEIQLRQMDYRHNRGERWVMGGSAARSRRRDAGTRRGVATEGGRGYVRRARLWEGRWDRAACDDDQGWLGWLRERGEESRDQV